MRGTVMVTKLRAPLHHFIFQSAALCYSSSHLYMLHLFYEQQNSQKTLPHAVCAQYFSQATWRPWGLPQHKQCSCVSFWCLCDLSAKRHTNTPFPVLWGHLRLTSQAIQHHDSWPKRAAAPAPLPGSGVLLTATTPGPSAIKCPIPAPQNGRTTTQDTTQQRWLWLFCNLPQRDLAGSISALSSGGTSRFHIRPCQ